MSELLLFKMQKLCVTSRDPEIVKYREQQFQIQAYATSTWKQKQNHLGVLASVTTRRFASHATVLAWNPIALKFVRASNAKQQMAKECSDLCRKTKKCLGKDTVSYKERNAAFFRRCQPHDATRWHLRFNHDRQPLSVSAIFPSFPACWRCCWEMLLSLSS